MLAIVVALLLATNTITVLYLNQKYTKQTFKTATKLTETRATLAEQIKESQLLKQELADLKYKCKELEKDLTAAKR